MKHLITFLSALILSCSLFAQYDQQNEGLYKSKVENYTKLKRTGNILAGTGAIMTVGGILLTATADWNTSTDYYGNMTYNSVDPRGIIGVTGIVLGIPMVATGIVLSSIGKRKADYYKQKLENLHLGFYQFGKQKGFSLVYTF